MTTWKTAEEDKAARTGGMLQCPRAGLGSSVAATAQGKNKISLDMSFALFGVAPCKHNAQYLLI